MPNFVGARSTVSPLALTVATVSFLAIGALGMPGALAQTNTNSAPPSAAAPMTPAPAATPAPTAAAPEASTSATESPTTAHKAKRHRAAGARAATSMRPSSVDRRIAELKSQLKITANEESDWNAVAAAMRENAKDMEQLVQQTRSEGPRDRRTALEDLQTYQKFADAHADGLKRLTSAFETLYNAMPTEQKHHADAVFRQFEHRRPTSRS